MANRKANHTENGRCTQSPLSCCLHNSLRKCNSYIQWIPLLVFKVPRISVRPTLYWITQTLTLKHVQLVQVQALGQNYVMPHVEANSSKSAGIMSEHAYFSFNLIEKNKSFKEKMLNSSLLIWSDVIVCFLSYWHGVFCAIKTRCSEAVDCNLRTL